MKKVTRIDTIRAFKLDGWHMFPLLAALICDYMDAAPEGDRDDAKKSARFLADLVRDIAPEYAQPMPRVARLACALFAEEGARRDSAEGAPWLDVSEPYLLAMLAGVEK